MTQAKSPPIENTPSRLTHPQQKPSGEHRLSTWLFIFALAVYLLTRLIRLPDFPIYFFTDEAVQTQHASDLLRDGLRNSQGVLLPTYFENGGQYNLSLSVYVQILPTLLFGKSVWVTRGVSALLTLIAAVSLGMILRNVFKIRLWWLGPMLLAATPAWFLHSRTAFETVLMSSLFAGFIYFYLLYRQGRLKALYLAILFAVAAFYAYSPGQMIMLTLGLMLLIADFRYHWQHRKTVLWGLGLLILLSLPYLRFRIIQPGSLSQHLIQLNSYWVKPLPLYQKLLAYVTRYLKGFNPFYWFWPKPSIVEWLWPDVNLPSWLFSTQHDLDRHTMRGYGHILWVTFPFWVIGLVKSIKRFKDPAYRTILLAALVVPSGAAIVDWGITRGMSFIMPTVLITALGVEDVVSQLLKHLKKWQFYHVSIILFVIFTLLSLGMLIDALTNGPTWYEDYGLSGMQYGGQQVFTRAIEIVKEDPDTMVLVSSTWANASDVIMRYFTNDHPQVRMGNINTFIERYQPLDRSMLFVMTPDDLRILAESEKFTNVTVEEVLPYPDGRDGFTFLRLAYVPNIEEIFEEERAARQTLQTDILTINGQSVTVSYPTLDINEIDHIFDGDPTTLIRTLEANPLRLNLRFDRPVEIQAVTVVVGGTPTVVALRAFADKEELATKTDQVESALVNRNITLSFEQPLTVDRLEIEVLSPHDGEIAHVHLWEVIIE